MWKKNSYVQTSNSGNLHSSSRMSLQEPLRMVKSYTQLLSQRYKDRLGDEANDFMQVTVNGVSRMEKFISDMLSYAQAVEAEIDMKSFACQTAVDWAMLELQGAIDESGASVTRDELPSVIGDPVQALPGVQKPDWQRDQISRRPAPVIHISAARKHADEYVISVRDNGMGIEAKYFNNIFVLFKRLHGRERSGSGVGLAVCKEIVERHGGKIWVESAVGRGSLTFWFTLLVKPRSDRTAAADISMQDIEKLGAFYLGRVYDTLRGRRSPDAVLYDSKDLVTHAVVRRA